MIADEFRRRITVGELTEGDTLAPEAELIVEFKVSRASLREALRILEAESLIEVRRGARGGVKIRAPREETAAKSISLLLQLRGATLKNMFDARLIIEPPLVGRLARMRSVDDLELLRRHLGREADAIEQFQVFPMLAAEMRHLLVRGSENPALVLIAGMLDELYMRHLTRFIARRRPDQLMLNKATVANHARMIDMIEARDAEGAEVVWRYHIQQSRQYILSELGEDTLLALI